jgi:hypothetical protein
MSSGSGSSKYTSRSVYGWMNPSSRAWSMILGDAMCGARWLRMYTRSPTSGVPCSARWIRIWWVRPVSSRQSISVAPSSRSIGLMCVIASCPCAWARVEPRTPSPRSATRYVRIVASDAMCPYTIALYRRWTVWSRNCCDRCFFAVSVRAKTSRPVVSRSRRCTTPIDPCVGPPLAFRSRLSSARTSWSSAPVSPSSNGTVLTPAGLRTTTTCASSNAITSRLRRARVAGLGATIETAIAAPLDTSRTVSVTISPLTLTLPVSIALRTEPQLAPPSSARSTPSSGLRLTPSGTTKAPSRMGATGPLGGVVEVNGSPLNPSSPCSPRSRPAAGSSRPCRRTP